MLGFRLAEGINLDSIRQQFGKEIIEQIWACLQPYYQCNWLEIIDKTGAKIKTNSFKSLLDKEIRLKLADPEGFLFSNTILTALFQQFS
jgi:oxygen-independent coproporphyrinogen-3 oxidase